MQEITKAQEDVLKALWLIGEGAVSNVLEALPDPKPAYTTVATVIKVLEKKGYITHKTFGKTHVYYPTVSQKEYGQHVTRETLLGLFNGSVKQMASHLVKSKNVSLNELEELKNLVEEEIKNKQK